MTNATKSRNDNGPGPQKTLPVLKKRKALKKVLESLLFVAERPVDDRQLARAVRRPVAEVRPAIEELVAEYESKGIVLVTVAGGLQFRSATDSAPFVREFISKRPVRLTRAQLETLAIVAYRQPVTRPEVDDIRGVDSGSALKVLMERGVIKVLGRKEEAGRPLMYGTSTRFLEFFGMNSLEELPTLKEFSELSEESRGLFEKRMGEPLDVEAIEKAAAEAESAAQGEMLDYEDEEDRDAREELEREEADAEERFDDEDDDDGDHEGEEVQASTVQNDADDDDADDDDESGEDA